MLQMFVLALSLYNTWNRGVFLLCKITNLLIYSYYHKFKVHSWKYTEKGYFFIEEYHPPGFDGPPGEKGFRVKPLDRQLRELNQKYVLPIGYRLNNMLIINWKEEDYSNLNFYDLYELNLDYSRRSRESG